MATVIKDLSQIKARKVRLVLESSNVIMEKAEALAKATAEQMDLILVQDGEIPVVKLADFTKLEYEKQKAIKANHPKKPKTVQIGPYTQEADLYRLADKAKEFIEEGHPVNVKLEVRGREKGFRDIILQQMAKFVARIPCSKPGKVSVSEDGKTYSQSLT